MSIVRKDWDRAEIAKWYDADVIKCGAKVQYSTNGGITWLPFQFARHRDEDITRIFVLANRGNLVREIKQEKVNVTSEQAQALNPTSTFMNSVAKAQAKPAPGSRHSTDTVNVFRTENGGYWFSPLDTKAFQLNEPSAQRVCVINRTTYYDAVTPNTNDVGQVQLHPGQGQATLRQLGYVFRFTPASEDRSIAHWWPVLKASNPNFKPEEWLTIRCARHYDDSLDEVFKNVGSIVSVSGGKWIWGWSKRFKIGDTWLAPLAAKAIITNRITAAGMALEPLYAQTSNSVVLTDNTQAEVTPEYIMGIRQSFEELLQTGDQSAIIDHLFRVIEFRNKCVDELKELNKAIEKARDLVTHA